MRMRVCKTKAHVLGGAGYWGKSQSLGNAGWLWMKEATWGVRGTLLRYYQGEIPSTYSHLGEKGMEPRAYIGVSVVALVIRLSVCLSV